jgi:hypothetical protein
LESRWYLYFTIFGITYNLLHDFSAQPLER